MNRRKLMRLASIIFIAMISVLLISLTFIQRQHHNEFPQNISEEGEDATFMALHENISIEFDDGINSPIHTYTKISLMNYLKNITGSKVISGVYLNNIESKQVAEMTLKKIAAAHPGIFTLAMPKYSARVAEWKSFINEIISIWDNGYLVQIQWAVDENPLTVMQDLKYITSREWVDLISEGGTLNNIWKEQLDVVASYLKLLETAGVVPICDFLPFINVKRDMSWHGRPGLNGSVKLYHITHEYLTGHHNFNFLIWAWSINAIGDMKILKEYWPGNNYVDIVAVYMMSKRGLEPGEYQNVLDVVGEKPISMEKMKYVPGAGLFNTQYRWTWFTASDSFLDDTWYNDEKDLQRAYNKSFIVNKENNEFFSNIKVSEIRSESKNATDISIYAIPAKEEKGNAKKSSKLSTVETGVLASALIVVVLILGVFCMIHVLRKRRKLDSHKKDSLFEIIVNNFFNGKIYGQNTDIMDEVELKPYKTSYDIALTDLKIYWDQILGSGEFGIVLKGELIVYVKNQADTPSTITVAVKALKNEENPSLVAINGLMSELKIMDHVGKHENIVILLGAVTGSLRQERKFYLVLENCQNGSLQNCLRGHRNEFDNKSIEGSTTLITLKKPITYTILLNWSQQIISGMKHLVGKKVVHGDLATRNVLLSHSMTAKLSDFGLSRRLYSQPDYVKNGSGQLPWRWMAIESLQDLTFSMESDIWAFGVTIWEIFTLAKTPFPVDIFSVQFIESLKNGRRLCQQDQISDQIYALMKECWQMNPMERPTFGRLAQMFEVIEQEDTNSDNEVTRPHSSIYTEIRELKF